MKIVHIQTGVPSSGDSTYRLNSYLNKKGYDSKVLALNSSRKSDSVIVLGNRIRNLKVVINNNFERFFEKNQKKKFGKFSWPLFGSDIKNTKEILDADVIIIAWAIGGFLNLRAFKEIIKLNKPTVLFMRDMWFITGGCHHSFHCIDYTTGCLDCHLFKKSFLKKLVSLQVRVKKQIANYPNVHLASPSLWLKKCAETSSITRNKKVSWLPNIVPDEIYKKINKRESRELFSLPNKKKLIGFGAKKGTGGDYKGWSYLVEGIKILYDRNIEFKNEFELVVFGTEGSLEISELLPFKCHFMGFLYDDYALSMLYNSLDVFVTPSIADNFPSTVLESISCGTPVVGFKTGGIVDMIRHKINGYLADYKDSNDLADGIIFCLNAQLPEVKLSNDLKPEMTFQGFELFFKNLTKSI